MWSYESSLLSFFWPFANYFFLEWKHGRLADKPNVAFGLASSALLSVQIGFSPNLWKLWELARGHSS